MPSSLPSIPDTIGRYEVTRILGQGAMGRVLLARDPVLNRDVAIKVLRDDLGRSYTLPASMKPAHALQKLEALRPEFGPGGRGGKRASLKWLDRGRLPRARALLLLVSGGMVNWLRVPGPTGLHWKTFLSLQHRWLPYKPWLMRGV